MKLASALSGTVISALAFAGACGDSASSGGDAAEKPRTGCGNGHCETGETLLTCPSDCFRGGETGGANGDDDSPGTGGNITDAGSGGDSGSDGAGGRGGTGNGGRAGGVGTGSASGNGGRGGSMGDGGEAGSGRGGGPDEPPDRGIGARCSEANDCDPGLDCMTSETFDGAGPAQGLCTSACGGDAACQAISSTSYCLPFTASDSFCVEGCTVGTTESRKCHARGEVACWVIGLAPTEEECTSDADCGARQLCAATQTCADALTACLPSCRADSDCGSGQFCELASGFCVSEDPAGLPVGSPCTPPAQGAPDPCDGFCAPFTSDVPQCRATCTYGYAPGCGWTGDGPAEAACLYPNTLTPPDEDPTGDLGFCNKLCDCDADCPIEGDRCVGDLGDVIQATWGRSGYCRPLEPSEEESVTIPDCTSTGSAR